MKYLCPFSLLLFACAENKTKPVVFEHAVSTAAKPWFHENFDNDTFTIITDLNGGERAGVFDVAIEQVNLLRPELIVTVGDLIDGGTENKDTLTMQWDYFDMRAKKAKARLFHIGGNHDLTNAVMREFWANRYGPRYYHFIYKDVLFLMLDSEDYSPERMQEIYLARAAAIKAMDGPNPEKANDMKYNKMKGRVSGEISKQQSEYFTKVLTPNILQ